MTPIRARLLLFAAIGGFALVCTLLIASGCDPPLCAWPASAMSSKGPGPK